MKNKQKALLVGFIVITIVVAGGLFFFLKGQTQQKVKEVQQQQSVVTESADRTGSSGYGVDPTVTPIQIDGIDNEPLPTEPPAPETATDLTNEVEYLDALIDTTSDEGFTDDGLTSGL
ncbi:MAG: hypothetical protein ACOCXQ_03975 [Patescibacteria group bacterium]